MLEPDQVTGVVLAGGSGRRMGLINKALVVHNGRPLYRYAVDNLAHCCGDIIVNTHRDVDQFRSAGFTVIGDGGFKGCGPLAGIHAALTKVATPFVAIAACDQLPLPVEVYRTLCSTVTPSLGAFACSGEHAVPTCAALPVVLAPVVEELLSKRKFALMPFMQAHAEAIQFADIEFGNVNSLDQIAPK